MKRPSRIAMARTPRRAGDSGNDSTPPMIRPRVGERCSAAPIDSHRPRYRAFLVASRLVSLAGMLLVVGCGGASAIANKQGGQSQASSALTPCTRSWNSLDAPGRNSLRAVSAGPPGLTRVLVGHYSGREQQVARLGGGVIRVRAGSCIIVATPVVFVQSDGGWDPGTAGLGSNFSAFSIPGALERRANASTADGRIALDTEALNIIISAEEVNGEPPGSPSFEEKEKARSQRSTCEQDPTNDICPQAASAKRARVDAEKRYSQCVQQAKGDLKAARDCAGIISAAENPPHATVESSDVGGGGKTGGGGRRPSGSQTCQALKAENEKLTITATGISCRIAEAAGRQILSGGNPFADFKCSGGDMTLTCTKGRGRIVYGVTHS
jgi:hypothetical protein